MSDDLEDALKFGFDFATDSISKDIDKMIWNCDADNTQDSNLTFEKIKKIIDSIPKMPRLDDKWFTPFAKENNHTYYLSFTAYRELYMQIEDWKQRMTERTNRYESFVSNPFLFYLGINVEVHGKLSNSDFNFYYEDRNEKDILHPVLVFSGFNDPLEKLKKREKEILFKDI